MKAKIGISEDYCVPNYKVLISNTEQEEDGD